MRRSAERLVRTLEANGLTAAAITGDVDQRRRLKVLTDFKEGRLPILVATDVASRGLHIEGVTHVVNYDLPLDAEDYVHRVGRTARAGASGRAISLACEDYVEGLEPIARHTPMRAGASPRSAAARRRALMAEASSSFPTMALTPVPARGASS